MTSEKLGSLSDLKSHSRPTLQQMATIDLGDLELEIEATFQFILKVNDNQGFRTSTF